MHSEKREDFEFRQDLEKADATHEILGVRDLAVLLRFGSAGAARAFAREFLEPARLKQFGARARYCRAAVLRILGVPLKPTE